MSEYFKTKIRTIKMGNEDLGIDDEHSISKARLSLDNIEAIYESTYGEEADPVIMLQYKSGDDYCLDDNFDRICKLHDDYLESINKNYLIKAQ